MHSIIRAAGYSLMTMFVSCGVGAQDLETRVGEIAMEGELPAHESIARLYAEQDFPTPTPRATGSTVAKVIACTSAPTRRPSNSGR